MANLVSQPIRIWKMKTNKQKLDIYFLIGPYERTRTLTVFVPVKEL